LSRHSPSPSRRLSIAFPSPRPSEFAENNTVYGQLYCCAGDWRSRPAVVLLHGGDIMRGGSGSLAYRSFSRIARRCNQAGFNAVRSMEPCHFDRHPRRPGALDDLNYLRMAEIFFAQGVVDIRAIVGWLLNEGAPAVALWGVSYGGWLTGLTVCRDLRVAAAVLTMPGVAMNHLTQQAEQFVWRSRRELLARRKAAYEALDATPLSLLNSRPIIPLEKVLIIEGTYDRIAVPGPTEALRQAWSPVECWHLPHSHLSWMVAPRVVGRVIRWLGSRLN